VKAFALGLLILALSACGAAREPARSQPPVERRGPPIEFSFGTTQGGLLSSESTRGRVTALLFVTTYDLASQLEARQLDVVLRRHRPRANAGAVVLEAPKYAMLADAFRSSLELSYPVALADDATRLGAGSFGRIDRVPTLIVLDREGRLVVRKPGLATREQISSALATASRRD
jgi:hypothetical protein